MRNSSSLSGQMACCRAVVQVRGATHLPGRLLMCWWGPTSHRLPECESHSSWLAHARDLVTRCSGWMSLTKGNLLSCSYTMMLTASVSRNKPLTLKKAQGWQCSCTDCLSGASITEMVIQPSMASAATLEKAHLHMLLSTKVNLDQRKVRWKPCSCILALYEPPLLGVPHPS